MEPLKFRFGTGRQVIDGLLQTTDSLISTVTRVGDEMVLTGVAAQDSKKGAGFH